MCNPCQGPQRRPEQIAVKPAPTVLVNRGDQSGTQNFHQIVEIIMLLAGIPELRSRGRHARQGILLLKIEGSWHRLQEPAAGSTERGGSKDRSNLA